MVNKINNNEIETTEGVDTENTSYTENEFKEESQEILKTNYHRSIIYFSGWRSRSLRLR